MGVFEHFQQRYDAVQQEEMSLDDYLLLCREDPSTYATAAERLLLAIGEPEFVDTSKDPRLSRIFSNKIIKRYPAFDEFYGMEESSRSCRSSGMRRKAWKSASRSCICWGPLAAENHR